MNKESHKSTGHIKFKLKDNKGNLKDQWEIKNLIVTTGHAAIAGLLVDVDSISPFDAIAIGTGTTAVTTSDISLETEITSGGGERRSGTNVTKSRVTGDVTNDSSRLETSFNFTSSFSVSEAGIFNAGTGGTMLARQTFTAKSVVDGDILNVTWTIKHN